MRKLILDRKPQEAVKGKKSFCWFFIHEHCKFLVQRHYPNINKKVTAKLPIMYDSNQELNVINAIQKINEVMQNTGYILREIVEFLYGNNNYKMNIYWKLLLEDFKNQNIKITNGDLGDSCKEQCLSACNLFKEWVKAEDISKNYRIK